MFYIGVDLGQRCDFTALSVVEREEGYRAWMEPLYKGLTVRFLERMALGTPYTAVARRVEEMVRKLEGKCAVAVDATGLGAPVVDMLRDARMACELWPIVITGGEKANQHDGRWYVPKRDLIGGLQLLLEKEDLRIAKKLKETGALVRELVDMRAKQKTETHDDLVLATALACWSAGRGTIGYGTGRLL